MTGTERRVGCRECGKPLSRAETRSAFCGRACRNAYTNRRMFRGAQLYDLFMALRYERRLAKTLNLWSKLCRLAAIFKADDDHAGRKSWNDPKKILKNRADLGAKLLVKWKR